MPKKLMFVNIIVISYQFIYRHFFLRIIKIDILSKESERTVTFDFIYVRSIIWSCLIDFCAM